MRRLFTAIEVPPDIATRLSLLRSGLHGARWVDPANYHVTLRFAGDIGDREAEDLADALEDIEAEAFNLELDGLGSFGSKEPRALWAGFKPSEALVRLQKAHERAARRAGLEPEKRNYTPHVTLAYLKHANVLDVAGYLSQCGGPLGGGFPVTRFVLFSARTFHGGGPYVAEAVYPLGGYDGEDEDEGED